MIGQTKTNKFLQLYYVLNMQGDVVALTDDTGAIVAEYVYNAWGEKLHILDSDGNEITSSSNIAIINPLRYRGYYYDTETGFYYLQSRYYDPVNHRFINADAYATTDPTDAISCNMFAYCGNNPMSFIDFSGAKAVAIDPSDLSGYAGGDLSLFLLWLFYDLITNDENVDALAESDELQQSALYYGCRKAGDSLSMLTPGMTFDEAYLWANSAERFTQFGKNTSWGLYTNNASDAYIMAFALGGKAEPVFHLAMKPGYYDHYHVSDYSFQNYFKHFHVWYVS